MSLKRTIPLAILVAVGAFFFLNLGPGTPDGFKDMNASEANVYLAQNPDARIIDIRTPAEFKEGHIKGAKIIDFYAPGYEEKWAELDRDGLYFVYCRTGNRSSKSLRMLADLGFTRIWHLKDGIVSWKQAGLPLVK